MTRSPRLTFTFDPHKKGLKKLLGDLEAEIMEFVWAAGESTVREVHEIVGRRRDLAYTTVMTVMSRLAEKGLLTRRKGSHKAMVYSPAVEREAFLRRASASIFRGLFGDFGSPAMSQLVDMISDESDERIDELARLIEEKRRKR